jgi:hypothetical protein
MTTRQPIPHVGTGNPLEVACPDCGHDVDHAGVCPKGCPLCTPVAVTIIGTNIVYDHGTEERARIAFERLP